ncbi:DUF3375 family protein [Niastella populi]|uniref:Uncharacterized protein n=1 Tax=Niastella populi TaxID=550983 RepID=A0A1V9ENJ3_9BACT|nr:DUF3375 family protein [Niastella populi]OQP47719.1 hypothetical protein A4R26_31915 [Niastella populi]
MTFDELNLQFKTALPLVLVRTKNAPFMLSFFYKVFKATHTTTITNMELRNKLERYLEDLEYEENDDELKATTLFDDYSVRATQYIERWSNSGFLRKYPNDDGEDLHELTSDTVKVMNQGKSFKAFWEFLMDEKRQQEYHACNFLLPLW